MHKVSKPLANYKFYAVKSSSKYDLSFGYSKMGTHLYVEWCAYWEVHCSWDDGKCNDEKAISPYSRMEVEYVNEGLKRGEIAAYNLQMVVLRREGQEAGPVEI